MSTFKPKPHFCADRHGYGFSRLLKAQNLNSYDGHTLDLSDVIFMDTFAFRLVFDYLPKFETVIPPKEQKAIDMYNIWVDSKKGLSK